MSTFKDSFGTFRRLKIGNREYGIFSLPALEQQGLVDLNKLPFSIRVLLENALRNEDGRLVTGEDVEKVLRYNARQVAPVEFPYMPARVILQDFTGVPAVVDLAAMRDAMVAFKKDPAKINPIVRSDLVIDHSVQVDFFGRADAFRLNTQREFERNRERYTLLRWAQQSFDNFSVVPPGTGIVHQVNLEYLATVVTPMQTADGWLAFPDTLVGTDSHTTMINGLSVIGWGVGGIEAEAVMLGQPYYMMLPEVVGFRLTGQLPEGATATDLVLTVTQMLRQRGVVGKFVEFFGEGLGKLSIADKATIANMAPEYGATMGFFPIDDATLDYLRLTGRSEEQVQLVEAYAKEQGLFRTAETPDPDFSDVLKLDMGQVEPSLAGPRRPQDRVPMREMKKQFYVVLKDLFKKPIPEAVPAEHWEDQGGADPAVAAHTASGDQITVNMEGETFTLDHGSVVIAAITSCTNTSNPSVMVAAGLVAKKALERGLRTKPWVKTSLAPGSQVVPEYLKRAGLMEALEAQRFNLVGFGCTTCIGNSGPLPKEIDEAIKEKDLVAVSVLSGNRNFEGRIHPSVRANYLASPPLVVAYALAGRIDIDFQNEPIGVDENGTPVYLRDIWPSLEEVNQAVSQALDSEMFRQKYAHVYDGDDQWRALPAGKSEIYPWDPQSTYIKRPPFFEGMKAEPEPFRDIHDARVLVLLGDSVTTDHISPAGAIPINSPAGQYLIEHGVQPRDFNSYGSRRGNHEVMMRGTFGNIRLKNLLLDGVEGGYTIYLPTGEQMFIYDAAMRYQKDGTPLIVIAGKEYGTGSSRDWAAKGTALLGVKAVIAESFERIHRSNLIGMGVLPLQFLPGDNREKLGLTGREIYQIEGIAQGLEPGQEVHVRAIREDNVETTFNVKVRLDTPIEVEYYHNGGILHTVLRQLAAQED
ncbi:MAG: aconitate hydratase AcnA [Calditrichaeota bacterium]|nr:MAG: aconitate hydratase AcnA [Calditrichota bacterium]